ncbi:2-hydroxyacyl-CoA dehydratase subunit D [Anaerococcus urinomassiliensis]|uniref:2-hydroxyacyl-CoA dehydratase subunit D n=1 Tax=Anaerococcus urinomassiliensis TaxID=1745712 RepID=UPI0009402DE5|nr:2-hydroxyacyl-CoA dehydratase [Anaerococcus urinomassiliensis]
MEIKQLLETFDHVAHSQREQIDKYLEEGKKVVGVFPYYAPEEIIHAAGAVPIEIWGGSGPIDLAKQYFPTFYYSLAMRCMEMALDGSLDGLSATMITTLDDTLRPLSQNYKVAVGDKIPMIFLNHGQHRKEEFGITYNARLFKQAAEELKKALGIDEIKDEDFKKTFEIYNKNRALKREFVKLAGDHRQTISTKDRSNVIKSSYFMLKEEHNELLEDLVSQLREMPKEEWEGPRVVTSGVIADNEGLLEVLDEYKINIVDDDIAAESRGFKVDIDTSIEDPYRALSDQFARMDEDPILYDPDITKRPKYVLNQALERDADACILFMMTFNDTEEMEYPSLKKAYDKAGVPLIKMGYDQTMSDFAQVRTQLETLADLVELNRF